MNINIFYNKKPLKTVWPDCKAATKFENKLKRNGEPKSEILYDLEIWMDKVKVTKAATQFEMIHLEQT